MSRSRSAELLLVLLLACLPAIADVPQPPAPGRLAADSLLEWVDQRVREEGIPGAALAIVGRDCIIRLRTWGVRSVDDPEPVTADALFRIASMSKTFAGTVAAMLVERQFYRWDTLLVDVFPGLRLGTRRDSREITLRHVLSQSTGLMPHAFSNLLDDGIGYERIRSRLDEIPTVCRPGDCYGYQNVVFSLTADVLEAVTGDSYGQFLERELFSPLGMGSASVGFAAYRDSPNATAPHRRRGTQWYVTRTNPAYYSVAPASGVNASIADMATWVQANLGGRPDVLPPEFLAVVHDPVIETRYGGYFNRWPGLEHAYYAIGWRVFDYAGYRVVHHGGSVRGYRSEMALVPDSGVGVVLLLNGESRIANDLVPAFLASLP